MVTILYKSIGAMKMFKWQKRMFDLALATMLLVFFSLPMIVIGILVRMTSSGPAIYWSQRVGRNDRAFQMPKFRSMLLETPQVATDQLADPGRYISSIGGILRKSSLDELPQLWSIIKGDMSFVGPRPALFNQHELIAMRKAFGIDKLRPGLTGWAQINGRDELSNVLKVQFDLEYLNHQSLYFDLRVMWITFLKVISQDGVAH